MSEQVMADAAQFARIIPWRKYRLQAAHLFPTDWSLRWFIRNHESALVASGALLKFPRGTYVDPVPFAAAALNLLLHGCTEPRNKARAAPGGTAPCSDRQHCINGEVAQSNNVESTGS